MGEPELTAISHLRAALRDSATLSFPITGKDYHIFLDESEFAIGATLNQLDEHGYPILISCLSKKLSPAERNYPTHEREFLALLTALRKWRHYVHGTRIVAHTDNIALRHWKTTRTFRRGLYAGSQLWSSTTSPSSTFRALPTQRMMPCPAFVH